MVVKAVLTDIEGTTSSVSFVFETLFPYARERMHEFVVSHADELNEQISAVRAEIGEADASLDRVVKVLLQWMDEDRKATVLKDIQGRIWREGYLDGSLQGHVYPDAVVSMQRWYASGLRLYVYSSGSVDAQKLIFGYSVAGDLTPMFDGYFDTKVGGKREMESYLKIADEIGVAAEHILFLSDVVQELDAAREAGMQTYGLAREGGELAGHPTAASFSDIHIQKE